MHLCRRILPATVLANVPINGGAPDATVLERGRPSHPGEPSPLRAGRGGDVIDLQLLTTTSVPSVITSKLLVWDEDEDEQASKGKPIVSQRPPAGAAGPQAHAKSPRYAKAS
jgi:hypothetical protein